MGDFHPPSPLKSHNEDGKKIKEFYYDEDGHLIEEYEYDGNGKQLVLNLYYPISGSTEYQKNECVFEYDENGNLTKQTFYSGKTISDWFEYKRIDDDGQHKYVVSHYTSLGLDYSMETVWSEDELTSITTNYAGDGSISSETETQYEMFGEEKCAVYRKTQYSDGSGGYSKSQYDPDGNVVLVENYSLDDKLTSCTETVYEYDTDGKLLLVKETTKSADGTTSVTERKNEYDADGNLLSKIVTTKSASGTTSVSESKYEYNVTIR